MNRNLIDNRLSTAKIVKNGGMAKCYGVFLPNAGKNP
jgi:hypothetical protein